MSLIYPLPTTGSVSFSTLLADVEGVNGHHLASATTARARLRAVLKEDRRREDGKKDPAAVCNVCVSLCSFFL
jgi:hypothetical protein